MKKTLWSVFWDFVTFTLVFIFGIWYGRLLINIEVYNMGFDHGYYSGASDKEAERRSKSDLPRRRIEQKQRSEQYGII